MPKKSSSPVLRPNSYFHNLLAKLPLQLPALSTNSTSQVEMSLANHERLKGHAQGMIDKLISIDPYHDEACDIKKKLHIINFLTGKIAQSEPDFFCMLIRMTLEKEQDCGSHLEMLFRLDCVCDGSLPHVHTSIQKQMNLKTLLYYIPNHPSQFETLLESNLILRLIINSQIKPAPEDLVFENPDFNHISHFFRVMSLLPPAKSKSLYDMIKTELPSDFPWPSQYGHKLNEIHEYISTIETIEKQYDTDVHRLKTTAPLNLTYTSNALITYFSDTLYTNDRTSLDNYLLQIFNFPLEQALVNLRLVFHALHEMSTSWLKYYKQFPNRINKHAIIIEGTVQQLCHMEHAIRSWPERTLYEFDVRAINQLLKGIVFCNVAYLMQAFNEQLGYHSQPIGRRQCRIIALINSLIPKIHEMTKKVHSNATQEELDAFGILRMMEMHIERIYQEPSFKAYYFEFTAEYQAIKANALDWLTDLLPVFEQHMFDSLHDGKPDLIDDYLERIQDTQVKKNAIQFIVDVCNELSRTKEAKAHLISIKVHYLAQLDLYAYRTGLELILDEQDMRPILLAQELPKECIDDFYKALHQRNFCNEALTNNIKGLAESKDPMVISYFISGLDYYKNTLNQNNKDEIKLLKGLIDLLKFSLKSLIQAQESKQKLILKDSTSKPTIKSTTEALPIQVIAPTQSNKKATSPSKKGNLGLEALSIHQTDALIEQMKRYARASRKFALYKLYLDMLTQLKSTFDKIKAQPPTPSEALRVDEACFTRVNSQMVTLIEQILKQQSEILMHYRDSNREHIVFNFKAETLAVKQRIFEQVYLSVMDCFKAHNQLISTLLNDIHSYEKSLHTLEEAYILSHIDELLLISFTGLSAKQYATLAWLSSLVNIVETAALQKPFFSSFKQGFLQAGVYGSFIAKAFEIDADMSKRAHQGDIDCAFYIDLTCTPNKSFSLKHLLELQELMHQHLTPEAQLRSRILSGGIATWHGFSYMGQECDITLKESPPTPVVSHCCIFYRLTDNLVKFLENGEHALLHIRSNRLNIIAPKEQHLEPAIMAHVLKKVFSYLDKGIKLTENSKKILGNLLNNEQTANMTITQFICSYGFRNPEYFCDRFTRFPLEYIIDCTLHETTLAEYIMRQAIKLDKRLNADYAMACLEKINFMPVFQKPVKQDKLLMELFQFCCTEAQRNQVFELYKLKMPTSYEPLQAAYDSICFFSPSSSLSAETMKKEQPAIQSALSRP